jgi:adhesin transport system membrane fusion protein
MSQVAFKKYARELSGKSTIGSSVLLLSILTLIALIVAWAAVTELDSVVRGQGKVISASQNQLVQTSDSGVIQARYVEDGQVVKKGDRLFDIDPIEAKSQLDQQSKRLAVLRVKEIRLQAEVNGDLPTFPDDLSIEAENAIANELALFDARKRQLEGQILTLNNRLEQRRAAIQEEVIRYETAQNALALIRDQIATVEPLVQNGLAPETRLIELQRDLQNNEGTAQAAQAAQTRLRAALDETESELETVSDRYITEAVSELASVASERAEVESIIPALTDRVERTNVRSPVDGVVNRINFRTSGAFVQPGDILLEIVPTGEALLVEARVDPKDIASVRQGAIVKTSLTAYDATRYGRIDGKVQNISADAITEPESGAQFYLIDITIEGELFEDDGTAVEVIPGLVASVDINSGKRTVLDYFWQPIARVKDSAFRE